MNSPVEWLEAKLKDAEREMMEAQRALETAQRRAVGTQKRFESCSEMLEVAKSEQQTPGVNNDDTTKLVRKGRAKGTSRGVKQARTVPDQVEELLKKGPLSSAEIQDDLRHHGRPKITANSVNTSLNRYKGTRFMRNDEGKWCLVEKS